MASTIQKNLADTSEAASAVRPYMCTLKHFSINIMISIYANATTDDFKKIKMRQSRIMLVVQKHVPPVAAAARHVEPNIKLIAQFI